MFTGVFSDFNFKKILFLELQEITLFGVEYLRELKTINYEHFLKHTSVVFRNVDIH
jgi:hypothetical protein